MTTGDVSRQLRAIAEGDPRAADALLPLVYEELRSLARARMRRERPDHTLEATELVHEAYLRLLGGEDVSWNGRGHFFAAAAVAMRRILIDHARARGREKRGGDDQGRAPRKLSLTLAGAAHLAVEGDPEEVFALDEAIMRLEAHDARAAQVVRLRYYAGLTTEETAAALNLSPRTVKRDWNFARAWLCSAMGAGED